MNISGCLEVISEKLVVCRLRRVRTVKHFLELDQKGSVRLQEFLGEIVRSEEILCEKGLDLYQVLFSFRERSSSADAVQE